MAEVFPPKARNNEGSAPIVYMYEVGYPGLGWKVDARQEWSASLPHGSFPSEAVVSTRGHLVTLDDYQELGMGHAVVIFDNGGTQLADYALSDLLTSAETNEIDRSDCGINWRVGAEYYFFLETNPRFYVVLASGIVLKWQGRRVISHHHESPVTCEAGRYGTPPEATVKVRLGACQRSARPPLGLLEIGWRRHHHVF